MKNIQKNTKRYFAAALLFATIGAGAQQVNTHYFIENSPLRHYFNPAFQPQSSFYLGFPVLGYFQLQGKNDALALSDYVYNRDGKTVTFLYNLAEQRDFLSKLPSAGITTEVGLHLNLLQFGFRVGHGYVHLGSKLRIDGDLNIPKDVPRFFMQWMPNEVGDNRYNFSSLAANLNLYLENSLGYSHNISDKLFIGVKAKYLMGYGNISLQNEKMDFNFTKDYWQADLAGSIRTSSFAEWETDGTMDGIKVKMPDTKNVMNIIRPAGTGFGFDFGVVYKPIEMLTLSASVIDFGSITWRRNVTKMNYALNNYKFEGLGDITHGIATDSTSLLDTIFSAIVNRASATIDTIGSYRTRTTARLNIGAEAMFLNNILGVGVLSSTSWIPNGNKFNVQEELVGAVNIRPAQWFNLSVSASLLNLKKLGTVGVGIGLRSGPFHWLITTDYVATEYVPVKKIIPVPYNTKGFQFGIGANIVIGYDRDKDRDGVKDRKDKCPDTPRGVQVDKKGCPIDSDGDGVPDYLDKCPNTPPEAYSTIDENGCPLDSDGDGVPDYLDHCPDTPPAAIGYVDANGCPLDSDGDGVPDYLDKCPNTPQEAIGYIDANGCPLDSDGDGVPDYLDQCPSTPAAAYGKVNSVGCPLDSDGDGVPDYLDKCPNTPQGVAVDADGCPLDSDGDGVPDYLDECPNTPVAARESVDAKGCPKDTDGDGIPDYEDNCPRVAGTKANHGCPEVKKEVRQLFQKALNGIQFESGKAAIKSLSFPILNDIVKVMKENPTWKLTINGHTDSDGDAARNMVLSRERADAVVKYLVDKGVDSNRLTAEGYGATRPVADNKTAKGKALNRRVEFIVEFEEVTIE